MSTRKLLAAVFALLPAFSNALAAAPFEFECKESFSAPQRPRSMPKAFDLSITPRGERSWEVIALIDGDGVTAITYQFSKMAHHGIETRSGQFFDNYEFLPRLVHGEARYANTEQSLILSEAMIRGDRSAFAPDEYLNIQTRALLVINGRGRSYDCSMVD